MTNRRVELKCSRRTQRARQRSGRPVKGPADLVSDVIARTETSAEISAVKRMYGLVGGVRVGDGLWWRSATVPYSSGRLQRMS